MLCSSCHKERPQTVGVADIAMIRWAWCDMTDNEGITNRELYKIIKKSEDEGYKEGKKVAFQEVAKLIDELLIDGDGRTLICRKELLRRIKEMK